MPKRIHVIDNCFLPGAAPGDMVPVFAGSVLDVADELALQLMASGRVRLAPDAKLHDATPADQAPAKVKAAAKPAEG